MTLEQLFKVPAPDLQRALTKVPNRLIAVAMAGASPATAQALLAHISPRRRAEVEAERNALGRVPPATAQTAVKNLLKRALGLQGEEVDAQKAGVSLGPASPRKKKPSPPLTARDFEAYLLHLRKRNPFMKDIAERENQEVMRILMRRFLGRSEEPDKE